MKIRYLVMLLVALLAAIPAFAGDAVVAGEVEIGLRAVSGDGTDDDESAKFNQYDNRNEGLIGRFSLFAAKNGNYLQAEGNQAGLQATVGRFDSYRLSLYANSFEHNYTYDALTVFNRDVEDNLTLAPGTSNRVANPDTSTWLPFDYTVKRDQAGARGEITLGSPFFLSFDVNQTKKEGEMPWGLNSSSGSPGSFFAEVPLPVDYKTTTATASLGYRSKTLTASLDGTVSSFDNDNDYLRLVSPSSAGFDIDPIYLPPDNDMAQIGGQVVVRELPLTSTLALRGSYAKLESDADILGFQQFDGEVTYTTASAILRSRPTTALETEIAYRYVDKENDSDQLDTGAGTGENELFHYTKHNASIEAGYRVTAHNRIGAGYEFTKTDRAEEVRPDAEETKDHGVFVEWKNNSVDFLTARLRYEYLDRDTDFPSLPPAPAAIEYARPFDAATKQQDTVRVMFDIAPLDGLDLGIEYKFVTMDYSDTDLGRTDEEHHEVIVDASVALPYHANLYAYVAYEQSEIDLDQRRGNSDPFGATQNNTNYNWTITREDDGWSYGAKLQMPLFTKDFRVSAAWDYQKNEGSADFSTGAFPVPSPVDIDSKYGDYTKKTLDLKAEYTVSESIDVIFGYLYEKYELDDLQYNDYLYAYGTSAVSTSYLSGAYAEPDYEAKIGYFAVKYKF